VSTTGTTAGYATDDSGTGYGHTRTQPPSPPRATACGLDGGLGTDTTGTHGRRSGEPASVAVSIPEDKPHYSDDHIW